MRKLTIVIAILLLIPGLVQAKTLEDLLAEKGVISASEAKAMGHDGSKVYWNKGTRLDFADTGFTANIGTQLQSRYEYTDNDEGAENVSNFSMRRARIWVEGTALNSEFTYRIETGFAGGVGADLKDAYLAWHPCDDSYLKMGQFKTLIGRQNLTHSAQLQFPDRAVATSTFTHGRNATDPAWEAGRDIGLEGGVALMDGRLNLTGQFMNGEGRNATSSNNDNAFYAGARFDIMGDANSLSESDIEYHDDMGWDVGAAYGFVTDAGGVAGTDSATVSVDTTFKYRGLSFAGEIFTNEEDVAGGGTVDGSGWYAQVGYFLQPKKFEIAGRFSAVDCDNGAFTGGACSTGASDVNEAGVSLNYYWWQHHLKGQLAYMFTEYEGVPNGAGDADTDANRFIFQLSSWF